MPSGHIRLVVPQQDRREAPQDLPDSAKTSGGGALSASTKLTVTIKGWLLAPTEKWATTPPTRAPGWGLLDLPLDRSAHVDGSVTTSSQYLSSACIASTSVEKLEGLTM